MSSTSIPLHALRPRTYDHNTSDLLNSPTSGERHHLIDAVSHDSSSSEEEYLLPSSAHFKRAIKVHLPWSPSPKFKLPKAYLTQTDPLSHIPHQLPPLPLPPPSNLPHNPQLTTRHLPLASLGPHQHFRPPRHPRPHLRRPKPQHLDPHRREPPRRLVPYDSDPMACAFRAMVHSSAGRL